jgi:hypothetical protein
VVNACAPVAPSLGITPGSANADPGDTLVYTVSLVNNDSSDCGASVFNLNIASAPAELSASLSSQSLSIAPGVTGSVNLSVTSPASATAGTYTITLDASGAQEPAHSATASADYIINEVVAGGDVEPPTTPTGLGATSNSQRVNLSWSPSTDNVAVIGYRVYRDGFLIATTTETSYSDRSGVASETYAYTVSAYDAAGNESSVSSPVSASKGRRRGKDKNPK